MTNRQLAAAETRRKLIAAAKKVIGEKGLVNTSIEEITEACGVSKGTFYTYFKRKEDIVFELSRDVFAEILKEAEAFEGSFSERLENYMVNFSGYIEDSGVKLAQEWIRNVVNPELAEGGPEQSKLRADLRSMEALTASGIERGELRPDAPAGIIAHTLIDLLYGQLLCWCMSDGAYSFKERTQEFCTLYLHSYLSHYLI